MVAFGAVWASALAGPTRERVAWIDLLGRGGGQGAIGRVAAPDGSSRTEASTYPLGFIHFTLSAADAANLNRERLVLDYHAGDAVVLVAMPVASRGITRWTWQTFWWTPAPGNPPAPSSARVARLRPTGLGDAAGHYAMTLCYNLLQPDQPHMGGVNAGASVHAYNPFLEARFGPADQPDSQPGWDANGHVVANNAGVQTNCMSCHLGANYNSLRLATAPRYSGARYVDLDEPQFVSTLQVDFPWSIPANAR